MFAAAGLFGGPRLVIPGGAGPMAAAQDRARRMIGVRGAGHVRLVRLLPGIAGTVGARHLVHRMVQPGMPFRRHFRCLWLAVVDDPALLAAEPAAATPQGGGAAIAVIAVAVAVGADQFAPQPGQQTRAERHRSIHASPRGRVIALLAGARQRVGPALPSRNMWCAFDEMATKIDSQRLSN